MKAPGTKWMLFIAFCIFVAMGLGAYFSGNLTFDMVLDAIERFWHPESQ